MNGTNCPSLVRDTADSHGQPGLFSKSPSRSTCSSHSKAISVRPSIFDQYISKADVPCRAPEKRWRKTVHARMPTVHFFFEKPFSAPRLFETCALGQLHGSLSKTKK